VSSATEPGLSNGLTATADGAPDAMLAGEVQATASPPARPRRWLRAAVAGVIIVVVAGGTWLVTSRPAPTDPIATAAERFAGHPRQADIRSRLNIAFAIYGLEATDENYANATAALVALRESAVADGFPRLTEMDILEGMIADGGLPGSTFPEAAGYAAFGLRIFPN
jgi:hypothetical protein